MAWRTNSFAPSAGRGSTSLSRSSPTSDIVVDVISGTSAGGINGILLAYALCNELHFGSISSLWRIHGDIRQLLRSPYGPIGNTASLLDSEGYYQPKLETAFSQMEPGKVSNNEEELVILQEEEIPLSMNWTCSSRAPISTAASPPSLMMLATRSM